MASSMDDKSPAGTNAWALNRSDAATGVMLLIILAIMATSRTAHYLLFHTMAELFAIVVSLSIFMLTWVGQRYLVNGYLIVLGAAYGAIGLVDVFHTLTFRGMNLFPGVSTNYPTQFWLIARFLEALALLCAPLFIDKKPRFHRVSIGFMAIALGASGAVTLQVFPATFIDGIGLTPFKVYSEYIIIGMMAAAMVLLFRARQHFEPRIFFLLATSLVLAVVTEFCFTRYGNFYDFSNELGHYFRFLTVAMAFMAIVISGVRHPMDLIFREVDALNKKLSESEAFNTSVFDSIVDGVAVLDASGVIIAVNTSWHRFAQENSAQSPVIGFVGLNYLDYLHTCAQAGVPDCGAHESAVADVVVSGIRAVLSGVQSRFEIEYPCHSPELQRWFHLKVSPLYGTRRGAVVAYEDISDRMRIEAALQESERRMSAVFQASPIGIVISRVQDGKILDINDAGLRLYHYKREEALGHTVAELGAYVEPQQRVELLKLLREQGFVEGFLIDFRTHDGTVGVIETSARLIEIKGETCLLVMLTDVTERERSQAQVYDQAFHDTLTRLPNRRLLGNRSQQAIAASARSGRYGAVLMLDLDNFKPLNDEHGHDKGDLLLVEVAARLKGCVREMDTVARVGGDEFVVMLSELSTDATESRHLAATVAEKIRCALAHPYSLTVLHAGQSAVTIEHLCTASIGVALFINDEVAQNDLLNRADTAMYQAKRAGRNMICFFDGASA